MLARPEEGQTLKGNDRYEGLHHNDDNNNNNNSDNDKYYYYYCYYYRPPSDRYEGFCADLAALLAEKLERRYTLRPVLDGKYGAKMANGSWNGMVGELMRKVFARFFTVCIFRHVKSCGVTGHCNQ